MTKKLIGLWYDTDKLNGWEPQPIREIEKPHWVLTDDLRRCIAKNHLLIKWSIIGVKVLLWHPKEVTERDFEIYNPPKMPKGLELKYDS